MNSSRYLLEIKCVAFHIRLHLLKKTSNFNVVQVVLGHVQYIFYATQHVQFPCGRVTRLLSLHIPDAGLKKNGENFFCQ